MTDAPFRPFETHLDEATALHVLREALAGAEDGELFLERSGAAAIVLATRHSATMTTRV